MHYRLLLKFLLLATFSFNLTVLSATTAETKPNIVVIFADDISARELPIYGSSVWSSPIKSGAKAINSSDKKYLAKTPVLDKMANEGCWMKTAWASTICSPSRAMMVTGRYAHVHKWWHNKDKGKAPDGSKTWNLYESSPHTIAFTAKKGGYATFWAGKVQMQDVRYFGFDEGCLTPSGSSLYNKGIPTTDLRLESRTINGETKVYNVDNNKEADSYVQNSMFWMPHVELMNHPLETEDLVWWPTTENHKAAKDTFGLNTFGPDVEMAFAFDFMERKHKEGKPFFIYHTSHLGHDQWDYYHHEEMNKWPGTPKVDWDGTKYTRTKPNITGDNGVYDTHGSITEPGIHTHINYLDYSVWRYWEKLKELGVENNTIFVFCADNATGGYGKGSRSIQKGIHVPFIIYAPGFNFTKNGEQNILVNLTDMLPTIAEIAGIEIPNSYEVNGESLWPYLTTEKSKHRDYVYSYHKESQLVRGFKVLKDGLDRWYDVSKTPADLISYPRINDWSTVSEEHRQERDKLLEVIKKYDLHASHHDAPSGGYGEVDPLKEAITATAITLNKNAISLAQNEAYQFHVTTTPTDATYNECLWKSSHPEIASVDDSGKVVGHSSGTATITAIELRSGKTSTATVTVKKKHQ